VLRAAEGTLPATQCIAKGTMVIARPRAGAEYDSKRIAVLMPNAQLNYFTGASWASPLPEQLRNFMVDAFAESGRFRYVSRDPVASAKTTLTLQIHEASVVYNEQSDAPAVHLRLTALLNAGSEIRSRVVSINEIIPAAENHTPDIIRAFNKAATSATQQIAVAMKSGCQ
jgi:ABC-type uncharacterized transport system auxiliary subunit